MLTTQESKSCPYLQTKCDTAQSHNMPHASSEQAHAFKSAKSISRWGSEHVREKPGQLSGRAGSSATQSSLDGLYRAFHALMAGNGSARDGGRALYQSVSALLSGPRW